MRKSARGVVCVCRQLAFIAFFGGALVVSATSAHANPSGGVVTAGAATISSSGSTTTINQSSQRAVIEWGNFDIAPGETTRFVQPSSSSLTLNRVVNSGQVTAINGNLQANGKVLVINPNGVLIGASGNVDVGGFVASTADIDDAKFMTASGAMEFNRAGKLDASVENRGRITIHDAGLGLLVAPTVRNSGVIEGNMARLQMAAGDVFGVDLYGDGLLHVAVGSAEHTRTIKAENAGTIVANAGKIVMTAAAANEAVNSVINTSGIIEAKGLIAKGGEIILTGAGAEVKVSGALDVSGKTGGGTIKIGGDTKGQGALAKAKTVDIAADARVSANTTGQTGDGGRITVWSDTKTASRGRYSAKGGSQSGSGGFVETSSKNTLDVGGTVVDTSAALVSDWGQWLLDPYNLTVDAALAGSINAANSNVYLDATNNITFASDIAITRSGVGLYASAASGSINVLNRSIVLNGGKLTLDAGKNITIAGSTLMTKGGDLVLRSNAASRSYGVSITDSNINTTGGTAPGILSLREGSSAKTFSDVFRDSNSSLLQGPFGGDISISAPAITGSGVCMAMGGVGCGSVAATVQPIALTVRADNKIKIYGGVDPTLTYTVSSGALMSGDSFIGALARAAGNTVGSYAITQGTLAIVTSGAYTYALTFVPGVLTIDPALLTITAHSQVKAYGDALALGSTGFDVTGLQYGDSVSGVTLSSAGAAAGAGAGNYTLTASGAVGSGLGNYVISYADGALTVNKANLVLTATNRTKVYGDTFGLGSVAFTASGLKNADTVSGVSLTSTGVNATANAGTHTINIAEAAGSGLDNYNISYVSGALRVNPAALTITALDQSKVYGSSYATQGGASAYRVSGLKNNDTVSQVALASNGAAAGAGVGDYTLSASNAVGTGLSNYAVTYVDGALHVTPAALFITAANASKVYGDAYRFGGNVYTVSGLRNADSVTGVVVNSAGAGAGANVGSYDIALSGAAGFGLSNYQIVYTTGKMQVTAAPLTITALDRVKTYGTAYTPSSSGFSVSGLKNADTVSSVTLGSSGAGQTAQVGSYDLLASNATGTGLSNYAITYAPGTLTVNKAALTLSAGNLSKTYGSRLALSGREFSIVSGALMNGDIVTGVSLDSAGVGAGATVGRYALSLSQAQGSGLGNYDITYVDGSVTVNKAPLTLVANNQSKVFGSVFAFNGNEFTTIGTLYNGDVITGATLSSAGQEASAPALASGSYDIEVRDAMGSGLSNYDISYVGGQMAVTMPALPAQITVLNHQVAPMAQAGHLGGCAGDFSENAVCAQ